MIKRAVQSTLKMFGFRLTRVRSIAQPTVALPAVAPPAWALKSLFPVLKGFGFDPKHIVDIGANTGLWTREATNYFPRAHYTLVEPQDELKIHIRYACRIVDALQAELQERISFLQNQTYQMESIQARYSFRQGVPQHMLGAEEAIDHY